MRRIIAALALTLLTSGAVAQTQGEPETVYSDAQRQKDAQLSRRFVQSLLSPSYNLEGQFSRWKTPICPHVVGMSPVAAQVVEGRIRDVALEIGAPLDRRDPCAPNITVFVTDQPQPLLDALVAKDHWLFDAGPVRNLKMGLPVQAWYENLLRDYNGMPHLDLPWEILCPDCPGPPPIPANDTHLHTGIQVQMGATTVLVDGRAVTGLTLGALGDYLALLTLAQAPATGRCQPAPSIANLFLTNCGADFHTTSLSDVDLAMLTALYQTPDNLERLQMTRLIGNMHRNLEAEAGR